jgi:hypothetical protein
MKTKKEKTPSWTELRKMFQETDKLIKNLSKEIGGISHSNGDFAEEYFANAFEHDPTFAGEHFDAVETNINIKDPARQKQDEFDLVLYNTDKIAIIETNYKARESNIEDVIKKADAFRYWFPNYKKHKIYLGIASLTFEDNIIRKARKHGIAVIRQRGGKTIVNDKNLKTY